MIQVLFFLFAAIAIGAALNVLIQKHVLYSALSLIVLLVSMSGLFVLLQADFLAVINIIVYAGAIMVLFIFVIMLLNLHDLEEEPADRLRWLKFLGIPMALFLLFMILASVINVGTEPVRGLLSGSPEAIGRTLFSDYLLPFEATSLLILIALMGAVIFAKKDL